MENYIVLYHNNAAKMCIHLIYSMLYIHTLKAKVPLVLLQIFGLKILWLLKQYSECVDIVDIWKIIKQNILKSHT